MDLLAWIDELNDSVLLNAYVQAERLAFSTPIDGAPDGFFGLGIAKMRGGVGHTGSVLGYTSAAFRYEGVDFVAYANGSFLGEGAVSIASEICAAAVEELFGGRDRDLTITPEAGPRPSP